MSLPTERKWRVWERDGFICRYCGKRVIPNVKFGGPVKMGDRATVDHVIPKSLGGRNCMDNLVTCCYECNHILGCERIPYQDRATFIWKQKNHKRLWGHYAKEVHP